MIEKHVDHLQPEGLENGANPAGIAGARRVATPEGRSKVLVVAGARDRRPLPTVPPPPALRRSTTN